MGGDHLQHLTQTNYFTRFSSSATLTSVFIDPPSVRCDGFSASDQFMYIEEPSAYGATPTSSSPSSHITMDDDCSNGSLNNNFVKLVAQFDRDQLIVPKDSSTWSVLENCDANNCLSSVRKPAARQKILKKSKTTMAKRKVPAMEKCDSDHKKKPRNETISSPLLSNDPKEGKQKMGDRIGRLQRLVSPLGKADTASVLSECIEYIKFLHEQVTVLSTTYTGNNAPDIQHFQDLDECFDDRQVFAKGSDPTSLRSRGLGIVPVSSAIIWHTQDITRAIGNTDMESENFKI